MMDASTTPDTLPSLREVSELNASQFGKKNGAPGSWQAPAIKAWKESGKKVIAFQCAYVPEEIVHAAGMMSVRLHGAEHADLELEDANAWMYINTCSFIRSCAQLVIGKHLDFLDGFVAGSTCDPARRLWDLWNHYSFTPFVHIMSVPRKNDERAHERFRLEVAAFKEALETFFSVRISDAALLDSIRLYNRTRELFRQLHELKKREAPTLTGAETQELYNVMFKLPREEYNDLLEKVVSEAETGTRAIGGKFRLLLNGSPLTNSQFIRGIEDLGGLVVADELCTGSRYWWDSVDTTKYPNPIEALSRRYLDNQPCSRMMPSEERFRRVVEMAKEYRVDGVVSEIIRYCVPYANDQPFLRQRLQEAGFPVLELDIEYGVATGQVRTRVQAFLEMLDHKRTAA